MSDDDLVCYYEKKESIILLQSSVSHQFKELFNLSVNKYYKIMIILKYSYYKNKIIENIHLIITLQQ